MRRFLVKFTLFTLIQACIAFTILGLDPGYDYLTAIHDKEARAIATEDGPRVLLVGGSNVAFGIDSPALEDACPGYQVTNLALAAGLGLDMMLAQVERHAHAGDVVILAPEYGHFADRSITHPAIDLLRIRPASAVDFSWTDWKALGDSGLSYLKYVLTRTRKHLRHGTPTVYCRSAFNAQGDVIAHDELESVWKPTLRPERWRFDRDHCERATSKVGQFVRTLKARGVTVYLELPPLAESSYEVNQETVETIRRGLVREPSLQILHGRQAIAQPDADFFDTNYHLTGIAKRRRTADLAEALIPALASKPTVLRLATQTTHTP